MLAAVLCMHGIPAQTVVANSAASPAADTSGSTTLPAFEVVSIKPSKGDSMMGRMMMTADGISVSNIPLHGLIRQIFDVSDDQLIGVPGWVSTDRFDIEAKVAADDAPKFKLLTPQQRWAMFLRVFQDRFGLKFHHETKDLKQYALVIAKSGPKLKEAKEGDTYANGFKGPDGVAHAGMVRMGVDEMNAQGVELAILVRQLSLRLHSTVVDKTGLTGKYDFDLKWTPDESEGPMFKSPEESHGGNGDAAPAPTTGPSIFTALQEQLGLKLESQKGPVDVVVIDHIEPPSPN